MIVEERSTTYWAIVVSTFVVGKAGSTMLSEADWGSPEFFREVFPKLRLRECGTVDIF